jgi:hypothetical protein
MKRSDDPGEIVWTVTPSSGTIEPFGEIVVEVVVFTQGVNARDAAYLGFIELFSEDVCVCRGQTLGMTIELVVAAEASGTHSYVEVLDSDNVMAAGELNFRIVPVDDEGLLIQDSGAEQFNPVITWVGYAQTDGSTRRLEEEVIEEIVVVCSAKYLAALDTHIGTCRMPTINAVPLAGPFSLSVELASGEEVGGAEYSVEVESCPENWFYHKPTGACSKCDLDKSICRGGKELPVPKRGFWSDLENAELGYVYTCNYRNCNGGEHYNRSCFEGQAGVDSCAPDLCSATSEGPLCGKCKREYPHAYMKDERCYRCKGGETAAVVSVFVLFIVGPISIAFVLCRFAHVRALRCKVNVITTAFAPDNDCIRPIPFIEQLPAIPPRVRHRTFQGRMGQLPDHGDGGLERSNRLARGQSR